jgi:hypothetical protein
MSSYQKVRDARWHNDEIRIGSAAHGMKCFAVAAETSSWVHRNGVQGAAAAGEVAGWSGMWAHEAPVAARARTSPYLVASQATRLAWCIDMS